MSLTENRTWAITCKRGLVEQCKGTHTIEASDVITSTASAEKYLREQGWTLHNDGATCPVCMSVWDGDVELDSKGKVRMVRPADSIEAEPRPVIDAPRA